MARKDKIYDKDKVIELYHKYGSINAVRMRTSYSNQKIKEILIENDIEIKKYVPERWDFKERNKVIERI